MFLVAIILTALFAVLLARSSIKPGRFRIERAISIHAPSSFVFGLLSDLREWTQWSPWEYPDLSLKRHFSGPLQGPGSVYQWESDGKAGAARFEITKAQPAVKLEIKLDFLKPLKIHNLACFLLEERDGVTEVTWIMEGSSLFISRLMKVFFNMEDTIGKNLDTGLGNLKTYCERQISNVGAA